MADLLDAMWILIIPILLILCIIIGFSINIHYAPQKSNITTAHTSMQIINGKIIYYAADTEKFLQAMMREDLKKLYAPK